MQSLTELCPPLAVYSIIALAAFVERISSRPPLATSSSWPPVRVPEPRRSFTDPWAVFRIHRSPVNLLGTIAVCAGPPGGTVLPFSPAGSVASVASSGRDRGQWRREYLRFRIAGIFLSRLLPGVPPRRAFAPFAGLANLSPAKTLLPIAAAATLWYGFLVYVGVQLGEEWEKTNHIISPSQSNPGGHRRLAAGGPGSLVAVVPAAHQHDRLRNLFQEALARAAPAARMRRHPPARRPCCSNWLKEIRRFRERTCSRSKPDYAPNGRSASRRSRAWRPPDSATLKDTEELRTHLAERYDLAARLELAARLLRIVSSDGVISRHEHRLMQRAADLARHDPDDLAEARRRVSAVREHLKRPCELWPARSNTVSVTV